jgi:hypothetical protein
MWAAIPAKKICAYCLASEQLYGHYQVSRGFLEFANLVFSDIATYQILLGIDTTLLWAFGLMTRGNRLRD